jgi:hypothetical protein
VTRNALSTPAHAAATDRAVGALTFLLAAGAFAVVLSGTASDMFELDRFSVPKELALNLTALLAALLLAANWRGLRATVPELVLGAFVVWSVVCAVLSVNRWIALRAVALTLSGFLIFLAARRIAQRASHPASSRMDGTDDPDPRRSGPFPGASTRESVLARVLALAVVAASLTGLVQAYGVELPGLSDARAPGGTFGNRNFLAHFAAIGVPLVALAAFRARRAATRSFWLLGLVLCGNAIVLTRSRAGWLGLAAAAVITILAFAIARRTLFAAGLRTRQLAATGGAIALGAVTALVLPNTLEWTSESPYTETLTRLTDYRAGSGRGRLIQYGNSMKLVARNPVFGTGPGNWFTEYPLVTTPGDPSYAGAEPIPTNPWPSSDWVAVLAERGPVGLALVLLAGAAIGAIALRRLRGPDPTAALDAVTLLSILAAAAVTGLFDAVLLNAAPTFLVAAAVGLLLPSSREFVDRRLDGRARAAIVAVTLGAALAGATRSAQQLAAIRIVDNGKASRTSIENALAVDPANHRLHLRLAARDCVHARAAARLMPFHELPRRAVARC